MSPKIREDERYDRALRAQDAVIAEETARFRSRLAGRVIAMAAEALDGMPSTFDEQVARRALADYDRVYHEESIEYIGRVLRRGGELEIAKRVDEARHNVDDDALPEAFQEAYEELRRAGHTARIMRPRDRPVPTGVDE